MIQSVADHVRKLPNGTLQFPNAPTGAADTGTLPPQMMPDVPADWTIGRQVLRRGLSADQSTPILGRSATLISVEMADGDERKTIWAPWSLFDLVTPAPG